jgi:hypothetical protein
MHSVIMQSFSSLTLEICLGSFSCLIIHQVMMELLNIWRHAQLLSMKQMLIKEEYTYQEAVLLTTPIHVPCFSKSPRNP